jgi:hypothetical protein
MQQENQAAKGWWHARYRIKWSEGEEPAWHIDLLLAHRLIAPVLHRFSSDITLWRFHRRAFRDDEGHQFSFTFYTSPGMANKIFKCLKSDALIGKMERSGLIILDIYDDTSRISAPDIADTSDGNWDPLIRNSWPFFIMGVCQMWLSLVEDIACNKTGQKKSAALSRLVSDYRQINEMIKSLWREQGCHSLLHHLNAIFGYEPVIVREINLRRF